MVLRDPAPFHRRRRSGGINRHEAGFTAPELMVTAAVLALLATLALMQGGETLARQRLEVATRRLALGLERGRAEAERLGTPCALSLTPTGWDMPQQSSLPGCDRAATGLGEEVGSGGVELHHNLPEALRFSSNGLVLDGGTVVLSRAGTTLKRCLVLALPLGIVRLGRYSGGDGTAPSSAACLPDPSL